MALSADFKKLPVVPILIGALVVFLLVSAGFYLSRPAKPVAESAASVEAKAYLSHLALSDVSMEATENFMRQQVIEVKGKISDNGPRPIRSADVYCLFYGIDGREIHRERVPIVQPNATPLRPGETRAFRLPFDSVPDGWNQALPRMVIAQITFSR